MKIIYKDENGNQITALAFYTEKAPRAAAEAEQARAEFEAVESWKNADTRDAAELAVLRKESRHRKAAKMLELLSGEAETVSDPEPEAESADGDDVVPEPFDDSGEIKPQGS